MDLRKLLMNNNMRPRNANQWKMFEETWKFQQISGQGHDIIPGDGITNEDIIIELLHYYSPGDIFYFL